MFLQQCDALRETFLWVYARHGNLRIYRARIVKAWLSRCRNLMRVFYLPGYSPELNPDELVNSDLKLPSVSESLPGIEMNYKPKCKNIWLLTSVIQKRCNDSFMRKQQNTPHTWRINGRTPEGHLEDGEKRSIELSEREKLKKNK